MTHFLNRRRFLSITAAAGTALATGVHARALPVAQWQGHALGAGTSMKLAGLEAADARPVFHAVELELERLERIFSLYRQDSEIVRLNTTGVLRAPAPELLSVLDLCNRLHRATGGAFDPTLQPLWMMLATKGQGASRQDLATARALVDWPGMTVSSDVIRFPRRGMALTLNGIAQGYVTDRINALLSQRGLRDILIDMGEIAARGHRPDGADWAVGVAMPDGRIVNRVSLRDRAIATSCPEGTLLDTKAGLGHILDTRTAAYSPKNRLVAVSSSQAAIADGLSTAGCLLSRQELDHAIGKFPDTELESFM